MSNIVNPFIAGSPVKGSAMFFGREDVFQFIRQTLTGQHRDNVIVLYGQRRTGKTSVLYQMRSHVDGRYLCIFMDMHGFALEGLGGFLWEMANHMLRALRRDYQIQVTLPNHTTFLTDPRDVFENEFLTSVQSSIGDRHILLMLDEVLYLQEQVMAEKLERETFEYLRYLMQHYEWLNFLFSLGSGLEEMEKEYAFLFNTGLYKKISFLDATAANSLITEPVKDYYRVAPAALKRIYQLTSGHPYYTQLLCHGLFNCWQHKGVMDIEVQNVDEVLNEAVELGSAVLKYSWEELSSGEKAVVTGMATAMGETNVSVDASAIHRAWRKQNAFIPESEVSKAIRSLLARDIIVGQGKYAFTVDLQRLWIQKHRRMEWVKEEVVSLPLERYKSSPMPWMANPRIIRLLVVGICLLLLVGVSTRLFYTGYYLPNRQRVSATATAQAVGTQVARANASIGTATAALAAGQNPYPPYGGTLLLNASLNKNSSHPSWDEGTDPGYGFCTFTGGAYHVEIIKAGQFYYCSDDSDTFINFAYQVQMSILKGDQAGLSFRIGASGSLYYCYFDKKGNYELDVNKNHNFIRTISSGSSLAIKTGFNQPNLIAVVAQGTGFDLYVNLHHLAHASDTTFSEGKIGFITGESSLPTEAVFSNAKVWKL